eukprot:TRINITY_DN38594_c0_g1_i1.p1 TRINITY_DN38594_c0_g1~~TRINITY_DN38594_c0_g1_i1.p1  ORF type:complete len:315 (+),score=70.98 TRINITY_DN38594_c0_g1_i1:183-1127(+)
MRRTAGAGGAGGAAGGMANDPFLTHDRAAETTSKDRRFKPAQRGPTPCTMLSRLVLGAPIGLFLVNALVFAVCWQFPAISATVALGGLFVALHGAGSHAAIRTVSGCGAVCFGSFTGLYAHEAYLGPFFAAVFGREYTNVLASSAAAAYGDAGRLRFADTSTVDSTLSVGYRDRRTFCAAPVVDSGDEQARKVGFWAVGMDCCSARGDFECGAFGNRTARGGLRLLEDGLLERRRSEYMRAVELAAEVNGLAVEDDPILVHWALAPAEEGSKLLMRAAGVIALGLALFLLLVFAGAATSVLAAGGDEEDAFLPQ